MTYGLRKGAANHLRRAVASMLAAALTAAAFPAPGAQAFTRRPQDQSVNDACPSCSPAPQFDPARFSIPEELGYIVESWRPETEARGFVVFLQDTHADSAAQRAISELVGHLAENWGMATVAVEGAAGECVPQRYSDLPDSASTLRVADLFLREGIFSGAEHYAATHPGSITLIGVESRAHYVSHLIAALRGDGLQSAGEGLIAQLDALLPPLRARMPAVWRELRVLNAAWQDPGAAPEAVQGYAAALAEAAASLGLDTAAGRRVQAYARALALQEGWDVSEAQREQPRLWNRLQEAGSSQLLRLGALRDQARAVPGTAPAFYQALTRAAADAGILAEYPALERYAAILQASAQFSPAELLFDIQELNAAVEPLLLQTPEQRAIAALEHQRQAWSQLTQARVPRSELQEGEPAADLESLRRLLAIVGAPEFEEQAAEDLAELLEQRRRFYALALERDDRLARNLLPLAQTSAPVALVAGGFHAEGILERLRSANVGYALVLPSSEGAEDIARYRARLRNEWPGIPALARRLQGQALAAHRVTDGVGLPRDPAMILSGGNGGVTDTDAALFQAIALKLAVMLREGQGIEELARAWSDAIPDDGINLRVEGESLLLAADGIGAIAIRADGVESVRSPNGADARRIAFEGGAGAVLGFYGEPYSWEQLFALVPFLDSVGLDTLILGFKEEFKMDVLREEIPRSPFAAWQHAYSKKALALFARLGAIAEDAGITLWYARRPVRISYSVPSNLSHVLKTFKEVHESNKAWRNFAVFSDDMEPALSEIDSAAFADDPDWPRLSPLQRYARVQADFLNRLYAGMQTEMPGAGLMFCPTLYSGNPALQRDLHSYLKELGANLHPAIRVMHTGRDVISERISASEAAAVERALGRSADGWDNLGADDIQHWLKLVLGPVQGRDAGLYKHARGYFINPSTHFPFAQIVLATAAEYARNPQAYEPRAAWRRAVKRVGFGDTRADSLEAERFAGAMEIFAAHAAERFLMPEAQSPLDAAVRSALASLRQGLPADNERVQRLRSAINEVAAAAEYLSDPANVPNEDLWSALQPWVRALSAQMRGANTALTALEDLDAGRGLTPAAESTRLFSEHPAFDFLQPGREEELHHRVHAALGQMRRGVPIAESENVKTLRAYLEERTAPVRELFDLLSGDAPLAAALEPWTAPLRNFLQVADSLQANLAIIESGADPMPALAEMGDVLLDMDRRTPSFVSVAALASYVAERMQDDRFEEALFQTKRYSAVLRIGPDKQELSIGKGEGSVTTLNLRAIVSMDIPANYAFSGYTIEDEGREYVLVYRPVNRQALYAKQEIRLRFDTEHVEYFARIIPKTAGQKIERLHLFPNSTIAFDEVFNPQPNQETRQVTPADKTAISSARQYNYYGGQWPYTAWPLMYAFHVKDAPEWLAVSLQPQPGHYNFESIGYYGDGEGTFRLAVKYGPQEEVPLEGWETPRVLLHFAPTPFEGIAHASRDLVERGWAEAPRKLEDMPSWWRWPMFCTWGHQQFLALLKHGRQLSWPHHIAPEATQKNTEEALTFLEKNAINPGIVTLDDKWMAHYDEWRFDAVKWPDAKGFIDGQHAKGRKVLLWLGLWHDDNGRVVWDAKDPETRRRIREQVKHLLSPEGMDADGFKLDWTHHLPVLESGTALGGLENLHELMKVIYDAAKEAKPDALIIAHTPHPYFADAFDMFRVNDFNWNAGDEQLIEDAVFRVMTAYWAGFVLGDADNWPIRGRTAQEIAEAVKRRMAQGLEGGLLRDQWSVFRNYMAAQKELIGAGDAHISLSLYYAMGLPGNDGEVFPFSEEVLAELAALFQAENERLGRKASQTAEHSPEEREPLLLEGLFGNGGIRAVFDATGDEEWMAAARDQNWIGERAAMSVARSSTGSDAGEVPSDAGVSTPLPESQDLVHAAFPDAASLRRNGTHLVDALDTLVKPGGHMVLADNEQRVRPEDYLARLRRHGYTAVGFESWAVPEDYPRGTQWKRHANNGLRPESNYLLVARKPLEPPSDGHEPEQQITPPAAPQQRRFLGRNPHTGGWDVVLAEKPAGPEVAQGWAEEGHLEIRYEGVPISKHGVSILKRQQLEGLGRRYAGGTATVTLVWSSWENRYMPTALEIWMPGAEKPETVRLTTVWGTGITGPVFLSSYYMRGVIDWKRWPANYEKIAVYDASLSETDGKLHLFGDTNAAAKFGAEFAGGRVGRVELQYSPVEGQQRYLPLRVSSVTKADGTMGIAEGRFKTVWATEQSGGSRLVDTYWDRWTAEERRRWAAQFEQVVLKGTELDELEQWPWEGGSDAILSKTDGLLTEIELRPSADASDLIPVAVNLVERDGAPPRALLLADKNSPGVVFSPLRIALPLSVQPSAEDPRWPPEALVDSGDLRRLRGRGNLQIWVPLVPSGDRFYLNAFTAGWLEFPGREEAGTAYAVHEADEEGKTKLIGVVTGERWFPSASVAFEPLSASPAEDEQAHPAAGGVYARDPESGEWSAYLGASRGAHPLSEMELHAQGHESIRIERLPMTVQGVRFFGRTRLNFLSRLYPGAVVDIELSWSDFQQRYVPIKAYVHSEEGLIAVSFPTVWGARDGAEPEILAHGSDDRLEASDPQDWHEAGYRTLLLRDRPVKNGTVALVGQLIRRLPDGYPAEDAIADVTLRWAEGVEDYRPVNFEIISPGTEGAASSSVPLMSAWGMRDGAEVLIESDINRLSSDPREWAAKGFHEVVLRGWDAGPAGGMISIFNGAITVPFKAPYSAWPLRSLRLGWSRAAGRYFALEAEMTSQTGEPRSVVFSKVWAAGPEGEALLGTYMDRLGADLRLLLETSGRAFGEIRFEVADLDNGLGLLHINGESVMKLGRSYLGGTASIEEVWSEAAGKHKPVRVSATAADGKTRRQIWLALVSSPGEAIPQWPPLNIKAHGYWGVALQWWAEEAADLSEGDLLWLPMIRLGENRYALQGARAEIYEFPAGLTGPVYAIYRQRSGRSGDTSLQGVLIEGEWIAGAPLAAMKARMTPSQARVFKLLQGWIEEELRDWLPSGLEESEAAEEAYQAALETAYRQALGAKSVTESKHAVMRAAKQAAVDFFMSPEERDRRRLVRMGREARPKRLQDRFYVHPPEERLQRLEDVAEIVERMAQRGATDEEIGALAAVLRITLEDGFGAVFEGSAEAGMALVLDAVEAGRITPADIRGMEAAKGTLIHGSEAGLGLEAPLGEPNGLTRRRVPSSLIEAHRHALQAL